MPVTSFKAGLVALILASLTVCGCRGSQEQYPFSREHADVENATTVAAAVTTSEPRNDTKEEVTSQASSLPKSNGSKATSSGWDTVYKLLYETFSYPEAKELDALLPLPTSYLTLKQRGADRKEVDRKKEQRQHASRELTYRTVSGGGEDGSGDRSAEERSDGTHQERREEEDPGSSESSSQSDEDDPDGDDEDEEEDRPEAAGAKRTAVTASSTPATPAKAHRRTERAVATGSQLPPPRPWREHGKEFGLPVREDRWSKHVAAKRREAQLIRRSVHDQLRMKALQWRQKENHFHQRYKPAPGPAIVI